MDTQDPRTLKEDDDAITQRAAEIDNWYDNYAKLVYRINSPFCPESEFTQRLHALLLEKIVDRLEAIHKTLEKLGKHEPL